MNIESTRQMIAGRRKAVHLQNPDYESVDRGFCDDR